MKPIGTIRTPYQRPEDMPIQPGGGAGVGGEVLIDEPYRPGLADLDGFSHIYLLYLFHRARRTEMIVVPFLDDTPRGVFATRSPLRPNHLGMSIVELTAVHPDRLEVRNLDILDQTPLLDIKPYIKEFDRVEGALSGWMTASLDAVNRKRSDTRFV